MSTTTGWMRNYSAMGDGKLMSAVEDFRRGYGPAVDRVEAKGGSIEDNQAKCEWTARSRGLIDEVTPITGTSAKTPPKFCPSCERTKAFYIDDYICVSCREDM